VDGRVIVVGLVVTAVAILVTWFGRFPFSFVGFAALGPFVAGFLSRSTDSKAFEGVASVFGAFVLAIFLLSLGR